jgi:hypothetical protein
VEEVWRPFTHRFAALALGAAGSGAAGPIRLPLLGS